MAGIPTRVWRALTRDDDHGPLPVLLLVLTMATGVVDAASLLGLGRIFVANMTGNVVFVGFALAGVPGISVTASLTALAGFLIGASGVAPFVARWSGHRGRLLRNITLVQLGLLLIGLGIAAVAAPSPGSATEWAVAAPLAVAMGAENGGIRRLAVPDMTTTVFTMALIGIAADWRTSGTDAIARRAFGVMALLVGALGGALLMLHVGLVSALGLTVVLIGVVAASASWRSRQSEAWHTRERRAG
jgi:uncharacterized membrane protein YoaK (UPF0700 family)